jgi:hypothetical protein
LGRLVGVFFVDVRANNFRASIQEALSESIAAVEAADK